MSNFAVEFSDGFLSEFGKLSPAHQKAVMDKIKFLKADPFYPPLRSKKLKGQIELFECSVNMSIRIIWKYDGDKIILLLDVGHHDVLKKY